ncbi:MAG: aldo/keto reductase, partial [Armatimonadetes bacterium]|nr:aldo/keto reductase [Armatimonadota bacterium]
MDYRRLGRAGMKVSALGLGTWLTFEHDQAHADELVDAAIEVGINFFDTANTDGRGRGEERLGRALARHRREPLVIATKVWGPMGEGPNEAGLSRKHLVTQCEASLRRLGIDHLDLYQCQRYDPETTLEETLRALDDLIRAGKVLYWGVSGWGPADLDNACRLCEAHNLHRPISYQVRYNLLEPGPLAEILPTCRRHGLGVVAYSPLAQGVLSGKYLTATPADSRLADERAG